MVEQKYDVGEFSVVEGEEQCVKVQYEMCSRGAMVKESPPYV